MDGLLQPWGGYANFCFPPFPLMSLVLDKIEAENALAIVVVLKWPNTMWWQRLSTSTRHRIGRCLALPSDSVRPNNRHCPFGQRLHSSLQVLLFRSDRPRTIGVRARPSLNRFPRGRCRICWNLPVEQLRHHCGGLLGYPVHASLTRLFGSSFSFRPAPTTKRGPCSALP